MNAGEVVGIVVGVLAIGAALWRMTRGIYRVARIAETALDRLTAVETQSSKVAAQLQNNGGNSARDVLDKIHEVALENREANARMEAEQRRAAVLAGEAATLAGTADQRIRELGELATERHNENRRRLDRLEDATREERIRREFYLATLRELYGIELDDPS